MWRDNVIWRPKGLDAKISLGAVIIKILNKKSIHNNKEAKFQAIFSFIHFFGMSPSNYRTMESFFHQDLYI
jgi:hypothetical protein